MVNPVSKPAAKARFLHFADCHLGYRQYDSKERYNDFARAFLSVIDAAIAEQVDFVILAGDLFEKRSVEALTLNQALIGLDRLRSAGIPCLAVEGNHERAYYADAIGWMEFLAARELLILLNADFEAGAPQLAPYARRAGAYCEPVPGVRVYGLRYSGASTARAVELYAEALAQQPVDEVAYTVFIAHAGVEGVLADQSGGLSYRQWAVLRPQVDYLALGHVHKPFQMEDWIFNPGSLETCSTAETEWPERGYYLVDVDTTGGESRHQVRLFANPRRPFERLQIKADLHASPQALLEHCRTLFQRRARDLGWSRASDKQRPVVELLLTGNLPFDRAALDMAQLEALAHESFDPLVVLVKNLTQAMNFGIESGEGMTRRELELNIVTGLLDQDARFSRQSAAWARLALALKQQALGDVAPEIILADLAHEIAAIRGQEGAAG